MTAKVSNRKIADAYKRRDLCLHWFFGCLVGMLAVSGFLLKQVFTGHFLIADVLTAVDIVIVVGIFAAAHLYHQFDKYGRRLSDIDRQAFLEKSRAQYQKKIKKARFQLYSAYVDDTGCFGSTKDFQQWVNNLKNKFWRTI